MRQYFLAPRSSEKSQKHFTATLKNGISYQKVEKYLSLSGREILSGEEVIYAWGNREQTVGSWRKMEPGDIVIFYAHKSLIVAGDVLYKQESPEMALSLWGPDENG